MPYLITDTAEGCSGWATIKDDGEVMGCHATKQEAIDQALAIAQSEGSEFLGERSTRELPDNYRPATAEDVPEGRACGNCRFLNESMVDSEGRAWCERWDDYVRGGYYCNAWEPAGENRAEPGELSVGDFVRWDSSGGAAQGEIERIVTEGSIDVPNTEVTINASENDPAALIRIYRPTETEEGESVWQATDTLVAHRFSTLTKIEPLETEARQVNLEPPAYMRASARRGLEWHREGLSGDGLVDRTVREAVAMAEGNVTADKWNRLAAWIARHLVDLDAPAADPEHPDFPSPGVVAMALWGGGVTKRQANRALEYARGVVARLEEENEGRATGEAVSKLETRQFNAELEVREGSDGMTLTGYAARFNEPSQPLPFRESIAPGAFKRSLQSRNDVKLLWNHDSSIVLGSTRSGTLRLTEDSQGLRVEADLPPTVDGERARVAISRGDVTGFSFGFTVPEGGDSWSADGSERTLHSVRLFEVSTGVAFPAYPTTNGTAQVRGLQRIAERAEVNVDQLADALLKIESGEEITADDRQLLDTILNELTPEAEAEEGQAPEEEKGKALLALKKKKLELLMGI